MIVSSASRAQKSAPARASGAATSIRARAVRISGPEFLRRAQEEMLPHLRVIQNLPNWIEDQLDSSPEQLEAVSPNLQAITRQAGRVERLVADMTNFEALRYHARDPKTFCARARLEELARRLFPDGPCVIEIYGEPKLICCDTHLFDVVFGELISNGVVHNDNPSGHLTILMDTNGANLQVSVLDDGPGVAVDDRTRVFEPFERLRHNDMVDGAGLGLSKVIRASGLLDATVEIGEAEEGCGTAVTVTLPTRR